MKSYYNQESVRMAKKHMKRCPNITGHQGNAPHTHSEAHRTPVTMAATQRSKDPKCCWGWQAGGDVMVQPLWEQVGTFLRHWTCNYPTTRRLHSWAFTPGAKTYLHMKTWTSTAVYSSWIPNSPKLRTTQTSFNGRLVKETLVLNTREHRSVVKEPTTDTAPTGRVSREFWMKRASPTKVLHCLLPFIEWYWNDETTKWTDQWWPGPEEVGVV